MLRFPRPHRRFEDLYRKGNEFDKIVEREFPL
jgi:hypothetical protein